MPSDVYNWLIICLASDVNYKPALQRATVEELKRAIEELKQRPMNKGRIAACERELRRRRRAGGVGGEFKKK